MRNNNEGRNILEEIIFLRRRILIREEILKLINISVKYNLIIRYKECFEKQRYQTKEQDIEMEGKSDKYYI